MAYTGDPENVPADAVRLRVGDTDATAAQLTDAEVAYFLSGRSGSIIWAAVDAARAIGARYARKVDKAVGDLRNSYSQLQRHYADLANRLEFEATTDSTATGIVWAAGTSRDEMETEEQDTDRPRPDFYRDQDENPRGRDSAARRDLDRWS